MKDNVYKIIKWAVAGNLLHLIVCGIFSLGRYRYPSLQIISLISVLTLWFVLGFTFGYKVEDSTESSFLMLGFLSLLPLILYLLISQILDGAVGSGEVLNYSLFYFLGLPIMFWNKPFIPIMNLFKDSNIYIQFDINAVIVFFVIFVGAYIGKLIDQIIKKSKKERHKELV